MESWHLSYSEVLDMPITRRHRLIKKKTDLEQKRHEQAKNDASMNRSRFRR